MFEKINPAEIVFVASISLMATPVGNEIVRSIRASEIIDRQCPPLLSEDGFSKQRNDILNQMDFVPRNRFTSFPIREYLPPEINQQLIVLEQSYKEAENIRQKIINGTTGPLSQQEANLIFLVSSIIAIFSSVIKEEYFQQDNTN